MQIDVYPELSVSLSLSHTHLLDVEDARPELHPPVLRHARAVREADLPRPPPEAVARLTAKEAQSTDVSQVEHRRQEDRVVRVRQRSRSTTTTDAFFMAAAAFLLFCCVQHLEYRYSSCLAGPALLLCPRSLVPSWVLLAAVCLVWFRVV